jgi:hypothetical protein
MIAAVHDRTGLCVVRVWLDAELEAGGLRARITRTQDLVEGAQVVTAAATTTTTTTTDEVYAAVREWLEAYLAGQSPRRSPPVTPQ